MTFLLLSVALAVPTVAQEPNRRPADAYNEQKLQAIKLDGAWTVVYSEVDGKKCEKSKYSEVTIRGNVVTCRHEGKEKSWSLQFGPHNMIRCTEQIDGKTTTTTTSATDEKIAPGAKGHHTHHGVYIASPEFFCISLNKGMDRRHMPTAASREGTQERTAQSAPTARFEGHEPRASHFVLILQRAGTTTTSSAR